MTSMWEDTFRTRMEKFSDAYSADPNHVAISIKVRIVSGCFHREHSPHAYEIIDNYLQHVSSEEKNFAFEEHESGPEILVYLALASSLVTLSGSVINLITTIIKARSESVKMGDHPRDPVELIVRRVIKSGEIHEEMPSVTIDDISLLTRIHLRHRIPPNTIYKTLTRTSRLQSEFQRAKQNHGESKAKAQKSNGPPSCEGKSSLIVT